MSRKYKFAESIGAYFISFATVYWIDVFTRDIYFSVITASLDYFINSIPRSPKFATSEHKRK